MSKMDKYVLLSFSKLSPKEKKLFNKLLHSLYSDQTHTYNKSHDVFNNLNIYILPKNNEKIKPKQLYNIKHYIKDTFSIDEYNIPERITPGYYIDSASRTYNKHNLRKLKIFCEKYDLIDREIYLHKYGVYYKMLINIGMYNGVECIKIKMISDYGKDDNFYIIIKCRKGIFEYSRPEYVIEVIDGINIFYIGGNRQKNLFFTEHNNDKGEWIDAIGIRLLISKLIGDLCSVIFSCNTDVVCTNDKYLRDRCIKNKVPVIYSGDITSEQQRRVTIIENQRRVTPKSKINIYFYIPIRQKIPIRILGLKKEILF
jgi:hypothetical protein